MTYIDKGCGDIPTPRKIEESYGLVRTTNQVRLNSAIPSDLGIEEGVDDEPDGILGSKCIRVNYDVN